MFVGKVGSRRSRRARRVRVMAALVMLAGAAASMFAGCTLPSLQNGTSTGSPTGSPTEPTPPLYFTPDYAASAKSNSSPRYSVAAIDTHDGHPAWRHKLEPPAPDVADSAFTHPVLHDGVVYVGYYVFDPRTQTRHSVLEALDSATGQLRWRHTVDPEGDTKSVEQPVVSSSTVYLSASRYRRQGAQEVEAGLVEALDSRTGAVRWDKELPLPPTMAAVAGEQLFVMTRQTFSGHLVALSTQTGSTLWTYATDAPLMRGGDADNGWSSAPLVRGQRVYAQAVERFPDGGPDVVQLAVNMGDGTLAWKYDTGGIAATPAIDQSGETVCISTSLTGSNSNSSSSSSVVGLEASTGHTRWHLTVPGIASGCAATGTTFYLSDGDGTGTSGSIFALDSRDGHRVWKTVVAGAAVAGGTLTPSISGNMIVAFVESAASPTTGVDTAIAAVRASDGAIVWKRDVGGRPYKMVDIAGGQVYIPEDVNLSHVIRCYSLTTGARLWTYVLGKG
jgi:outer membrane protein assembly factor BamB